jgi:hypothetical protein
MSSGLFPFPVPDLDRSSHQHGKSLYMTWKMC